MKNESQNKKDLNKTNRVEVGGIGCVKGEGVGDGVGRVSGGWSGRDWWLWQGGGDQELSVTSRKTGGESQR